MKRLPITTWAVIKIKLEDKLLSINYIDTVFKQLIAFKQMNLLMEYTEKFHYLTVLCK